MDNRIKNICELLGITPEEAGPDCKNIIINNDIFEDDIPGIKPDNYPTGWITKAQWDKFYNSRPYNEYWLDWLDILEENCDYLLALNAIKLKER